ncbi:MAG: hypothetical protein QMB24_11725 [Spirosomataceae bacterium]
MPSLRLSFFYPTRIGRIEIRPDKKFVAMPLFKYYSVVANRQA